MMMMKTKEKQMAYNGWTNHETWLVNLWFGDMFSDMAADGEKIDAEFVENSVQDYLEESMGAQAGLIADFVNSAIGSVNWRELAEHYAEDEESEDDSEDDSMDGDAASALASAGLGTDEDYGYTGDVEDLG
jgi:hypothetical protein